MSSELNSDKEKNRSQINIGDVNGGIHDSKIAGRDIIEHRNLFQIIIQTVPQPLVIGAGITILCLIGLGIANLEPVKRLLFYRETIMQGDFNIVVTQFQVSGQGEGLEDAQELALTFANAISREMESLEEEMKQKIEIGLPNESRLVNGRSEEERAKSADKLAGRIHADVVIYGVIDVDGLKAEIKPEFYVKSDEFDPVAEVTGQYRMGSKISIDKIDNISRKSQVGDIFAKRAQALAFLVYGMSDFVIGDYETAKNTFKKALQISDWDNPDVIYVMLGNSALKQNNFAEAQEYYQQALETNLKYARAYSGLGSAFYFQALGDTRSETYDTIDIELLTKSVETYQKAFNSDLEHPPLADVTTRVNFGMGQAYLLKAITEADRGYPETSRQTLEKAIQALQKVIYDYGEGNNLRVKEVAAYTHGHLGLIYRLTNQPQKAIPEYEQALTLLPRLERTKAKRIEYEAALGDINHKLGQPGSTLGEERNK